MRKRTCGILGARAEIIRIAFEDYVFILLRADESERAAADGVLGNFGPGAARNDSHRWAHQGA